MKGHHGSFTNPSFSTRFDSSQRCICLNQALQHSKNQSIHNRVLTKSHPFKRLSSFTILLTTWKATLPKKLTFLWCLSSLKFSFSNTMTLVTLMKPLPQEYFIVLETIRSKIKTTNFLSKLIWRYFRNLSFLFFLSCITLKKMSTDHRSFSRRKKWREFCGDFSWISSKSFIIKSRQNNLSTFESGKQSLWKLATFFWLNSLITPNFFRWRAWIILSTWLNLSLLHKRLSRE